jgi:hypothetical protein
MGTYRAPAGDISYDNRPDKPRLAVCWKLPDFAGDRVHGGRGAMAPAFPARGWQNPTLTMMALTARCCGSHWRGLGPRAGKPPRFRYIVKLPCDSRRAEGPIRWHVFACTHQDAKAMVPNCIDNTQSFSGRHIHAYFVDKASCCANPLQHSHSRRLCDGRRQ